MKKTMLGTQMELTLKRWCLSVYLEACKKNSSYQLIEQLQARAILFNLKGKPVYSSQKNLHNISLKAVGLNTIQKKFGAQQQKHLRTLLTKLKKSKVIF